MNKLKVLFLAANPINTERLRLDVEIREITDKIRASDARDSFELISRWAVRPDDLLQALNEHRPTIVHFSGHGSCTQGVILEDKNGISHPVGKEALKFLFHTLAGNIRLVVLNACFSLDQAEAIADTISCAVGTNTSIGDEAAIIFAAAFYRAIGFGCSIQEAFDQGKAALMLNNIPGAEAVNLMVKGGINASSLILLKNRSYSRRPLDIRTDDVSIDRFYKKPIR